MENLIQSLRRAGCSSLVVGSVDANLTAWLTEREVPTFAIDLGRDAQDADTSGNLEWRGRTYLKLMKAKVSTILTGIRLGYSVLWTDSDVVWLRNPIPLLARYPDHDVLASSDHMYSAERTEKLEHHNNYYYQPNTGIALYRPSAEHVVLGWLYCLSEGKDSDQPCLGRLLQRDLKPIESPEANAALYVAVQVLWWGGRGCILRVRFQIFIKAVSAQSQPSPISQTLHHTTGHTTGRPSLARCPSTTLWGDRCGWSSTPRKTPVSRRPTPDTRPGSAARRPRSTAFGTTASGCWTAPTATSTRSASSATSPRSQTASCRQRPRTCVCGGVWRPECER